MNSALEHSRSLWPPLTLSHVSLSSEKIPHWDKCSPIVSHWWLRALQLNKNTEEGSFNHRWSLICEISWRVVCFHSKKKKILLCLCPSNTLLNVIHTIAHFICFVLLLLQTTSTCKVLWNLVFACKMQCNANMQTISTTHITFATRCSLFKLEGATNDHFFGLGCVTFLS